LSSSSSSISKGSSSSTTWTAVDADVLGDQLVLVVTVRALVRRHQAAGAFDADLGTADVLAVLRVGIDVRLLLGDPLVERLPLHRFVGRRTESFARGPLLRRRVALVEQILDTPIVQGVLRLQLIFVVDAVAAVVLTVVLRHAPTLARTTPSNQGGPA
jgi:hypothetical protein